MSDKPSKEQERDAVRISDLLARVQSELNPVFQKLHELRDQCDADGQRRIAWEITQGIRALDEAVTLMKVYQSGKPLPTLAEIQGIYKRANSD